MKIGIIASIWIRIPPPGFGFGAQEYLAYALGEGLVKKGHEVTIFASADSQTSGKLVSITPTGVGLIPSSDRKVKDIFELMNIHEAYKQADKFDIIHNQLLPYGLLYGDLFKTPTVHTLHHVIYKDRSDIHLYEKFAQQNYISISKAQQFIMPELNYVNTVYNGIDPTFYTYQEQPQGNYLLYLGRIKRYKGIHTAIQVAKQLDLPLKIAAPLPFPMQSDYDDVMDYWEKDVKPQLGGTIEHIGVLEGQAKVAMLQNAKALIFPVERAEPFGMTVIEAMSCGTPVIAYEKGALPELMVDGKHGYLVQPGNTKHLEEKTKNLYDLSSQDYLAMRKQSREQVEKHLTIDLMVDGYEKTYEKILRDQK